MGNNLCGASKDSQIVQEILTTKNNLKRDETEQALNQDSDEKARKARSGHHGESIEWKAELESNYEELGQKIEDYEFFNLFGERNLEIQREYPLKCDEDLIKYEISENLLDLQALRLPNGDIYRGQWSSDRVQEGFGIMIKNDGKILEGVWKNGNFVVGRIFNTNGSIYSGEVENEMPHGEGAWRENDWMYTGSFQNGMKHGQGQWTFQDGAILTADFENDKPFRGKFSWADGSIYEGEFNNFTMGPRGIFYAPSGNFYDGYFLNNNFNGEGTFDWVGSNNMYLGEYKGGRKEGKGIYYFKYPQRFYTGPWLHGKPHGYGEVQSENKIVKGLWRYGKLLQITSEKVKNNEENNEEIVVSDNLDPYNLVFLKEDINLRNLSHLHRNDAYYLQTIHKFKPIVANSLNMNQIILDKGNDDFNQNIENGKNVIVAAKVEEGHEEIVRARGAGPTNSENVQDVENVVEIVPENVVENAVEIVPENDGKNIPESPAEVEIITKNIVKDVLEQNPPQNDNYNQVIHPSQVDNNFNQVVQIEKNLDIASNQAQLDNDINLNGVNQDEVRVVIDNAVRRDEPEVNIAVNDQNIEA